MSKQVSINENADRSPLNTRTEHLPVWVRVRDMGCDERGGLWVKREAPSYGGLRALPKLARTLLGHHRNGGFELSRSLDTVKWSAVPKIVGQVDETVWMKVVWDR